MAKARGVDAIKRINAWLVSCSERPIPREYGYVLFANELVRIKDLGRGGNFSLKSEAKIFLRDFADTLVRRGAYKNRLPKAPRPKAKKATRPVGVKVTRTVAYVYDESDNARLDQFYASREWKLMRYEALRLHGARCQCCGASAVNGASLNVDHIKPLRVFWDLRLELSNLQVLCGDCNEGKGARHADDWR